MIKEKIKSLLNISEDKFSIRNKHSLFNTVDSFLASINEESFDKRKVTNGSTNTANANLSNLNCDIIGKDIQQIVVNNAKYVGRNGVNLLTDRPLEEDLGKCIVICKSKDLEVFKGSGLANSIQTKICEKINKAFAFKGIQGEHLCECGGCPKSATKHTSTMQTIDFAKGKKCLELETRKLINQALIEDYFVIHIPKNIKTSKAIQIVTICNEEKPSFIQDRIGIYAEEGSNSSFIQCTDSDNKTNAFINNLCEINLEKNANLEYISLHNMNNNCTLFNNLQGNVGESANLNTFFISFNGGKTDNAQEVNLIGKNASANCFGLNLSDENQFVNNHIKINHLNENTKSKQFFKGVLDDSASGSFKGHIFVAPIAQQTEAYQSNKNLLLSPKAQFNTKPYLEIYADDVKCSHGASVGQIDENALFYMRCRGISQTQARKMLMYAFTLEVISEVSIESIKESLSTLVSKRLNGELNSCDSCSLHCNEDSAICNRV